MSLVMEPLDDAWFNRVQRKRLPKSNKTWDVRICMHPSHKPPMHIVIPPGEEFEHVCQGCGDVTFLRSLSVIL